MSDIGTCTANTICMVYIINYDLRDDYENILYVRWYRHYVIYNIIYSILYNMVI